MGTLLVSRVLRLYFHHLITVRRFDPVEKQAVRQEESNEFHFDLLSKWRRWRPICSTRQQWKQRNTDKSGNSRNAAEAASRTTNSDPQILDKNTMLIYNSIGRQAASVGEWNRKNLVSQAEKTNPKKMRPETKPKSTQQQHKKAGEGNKHVITWLLMESHLTLHFSHFFHFKRIRLREFQQ